jgi:hypothetical protein
MEFQRGLFGFPLLPFDRESDGEGFVKFAFTADNGQKLILDPSYINDATAVASLGLLIETLENLFYYIENPVEYYDRKYKS